MAFANVNVQRRGGAWTLPLTKADAERIVEHALSLRMQRGVDCHHITDTHQRLNAVMVRDPQLLPYFRGEAVAVVVAALLLARVRDVPARSYLRPAAAPQTAGPRPG